MLNLLTRDGPEELARSYTHVIIDEAHERDTDLDLVLVALPRRAMRAPPPPRADGEGTTRGR